MRNQKNPLHVSLSRMAEQVACDIELLKVSTLGVTADDSLI